MVLRRIQKEPKRIRILIKFHEIIQQDQKMFHINSFGKQILRVLGTPHTKMEYFS